MPKEDLLKEFEEITQIAEKEKEVEKKEVKGEEKPEPKKKEGSEEKIEKKEEVKEKKPEEKKEEEKKEEKGVKEFEEEEEEDKEKSLRYIGALLLIIGIILYIYAIYARVVLQWRILYYSGWVALAGAGLFALGGGLFSKGRRR